MEFKNFVLKFSASNPRSNKAILLLHGFPSESFNGTPQEKNADLAKALSKSLDLDTFVPHYNGLGKNKDGQFSFIESVSDSLELTNKLLKDYDELVIIGHSWGGLVAINAFYEYHPRVPRMILLSPFSKIPERLMLGPVLESLLIEFPHILKNKTINDFLDEFEYIKSSLDPQAKAQDLNYSGKILILQAAHDNEIPKDSTLELTTYFKGKIECEIVDTDHSFSENREAIFDRCISYLKAND